MRYKIQETEQYSKWFKSINAIEVKSRINKRIRKISTDGHFGDFKNLGDGLFELRFHFNSGYRVYYTIKGDRVIILLIGGNKDSQNRDIEEARMILKEIGG